MGPPSVTGVSPLSAATRPTCVDRCCTDIYTQESPGPTPLPLQRLTGDQLVTWASTGERGSAGCDRAAGTFQAHGRPGRHLIDNTYNAHHLLVLEGLEAVRKRPGMYIGSTDTRGLMHCLWEIIDNSVDEALAGVCNRIDVTLHHDGSAEVGDNGRGIPVDKEPKTGLSGVEV